MSRMPVAESNVPVLCKKGIRPPKTAEIPRIVANETAMPAVAIAKPKKICEVPGQAEQNDTQNDQAVTAVKSRNVRNRGSG